MLFACGYLLFSLPHLQASAQLHRTTVPETNHPHPLHGSRTFASSRPALTTKIYAINSWLGLLLWKKSIYFDIPRDWYAVSTHGHLLTIFLASYEAYALYQFFTLLVAFLDGERRLVRTFTHSEVALMILAQIPVLEEKPRLQWFWPLHCFTFKPGLEFYYTARLLILQFVILKPLLSIVRILASLFRCIEVLEALACAGGI